ncbi:MAG: hypothetical protein Q9227_006132 [Pyrenula ochraceoflavens]
MANDLVEQTFQAALLSATSNLIAQGVAAYQNRHSFSLDVFEFFKYVFYGILNTPPNALWQQYLENKFPSEPEGKQKSRRDTVSSSTTNLVAKFALDQTVGAIFNILLFVVATNAMNGVGLGSILKAIKQDSLEIYTSGLVIWPLVSLISFVAIPVQRRVLFGSIAGVLWGVYLSLVSLRE